MNDATLQAPPQGESRHAGRVRQILPVAIMQLPKGVPAAWRDASEDMTDGTAHLEQPVVLVKHGEAVGARAIEIARNLGLPNDLMQAVGDAARWHDVGKVDRRFQAMLFDGDPVRAAIADEPLAKSGMPPGELQRHRDARRRSGMPRGARHEAWSHSLVAEYLAGQPESYGGDTELVLHLIASHHGHARPLLPAIIDTADHQLTAVIDGVLTAAPLPKKVDVNHAQRFQDLNARYGRWGLALLEAIVRCADMTVSGEGS
ncbi:MAG: CRISPR-associated endonuclease Cas3'' [Tessaracoccus sp.]